MSNQKETVSAMLQTCGTSEIHYEFRYGSVDGRDAGEYSATITLPAFTLRGIRYHGSGGTSENTFAPIVLHASVYDRPLRASVSYLRVYVNGSASNDAPTPMVATILRDAVSAIIARDCTPEAMRKARVKSARWHADSDRAKANQYIENSDHWARVAAELEIAANPLAPVKNLPTLGRF